MWRVRTMPGVARAFAAAWDVGADDLLTGFDSCAVTRNLWLFEEHAQEQACARATAANSSTAGAGVAGVDDASHSWALNREKAQWFHVDQHAHALPGLSTYQGLLTFYPCNRATGGTVLVPESHKRFASIFSGQNGNAREPASEGFVALNKPGDRENFCAGAVQVSLQSGDLLLWDSRTVHCNQGLLRAAGPRAAMPGRESELLSRLVAFVCMIPRLAVEAAALEDPDLHARRRRYVIEGHTGPHHPALLPDPELPFWGTTMPEHACAPPPPSNTAAWALIGCDPGALEEDISVMDGGGQELEPMRQHA